MRASGSGGSVGEVVVDGGSRGSGGARETAFASMRLESSWMIGLSWRWGRSGEEGEDQPGWDMMPHGGMGFSGSELCSPGAVDCTCCPGCIVVFLLRCLGRHSNAMVAVSSNFSATSFRTLFSTWPFSSGDQALGMCNRALRLAYSRLA